jgi:UDP-N-acetylglucosamine--N-acetylmuramyl-(pentapeptide) pyrophosphoryl-undecaprenol N-acetylglucosamine transferase
MSASIRLLLAGGGTGGHLYPGIALAEAFTEQCPDGQVLFVGTEGGLEKTLLPQQGYDVSFVRASRVKGAGLWARITAVFRLPLGIWDAWRILSRFRPNLVVSVGGYAAAPTAIAAWLRRIPTVAVEPNAVPGLTNRVLGKLAKHVLVAHEQALQWFSKTKATVVGVPLRKGIVVRLRAASDRLTPRSSNVARVLVFGGSQGARFLNERMPAVLRDLPITVLHQTGPKDVEMVRDGYRNVGVDADVRPYLDDMASAYASCDLAVTRAGASTVAELALTSTPALLIPFPFAADDHQAANARMLSDVEAARMVRQSDWNDEDIREWLRACLADSDRLAQMATRAGETASPTAARDAISICLAVLTRNKRTLHRPVGVL